MSNIDLEVYKGRYVNTSRSIFNSNYIHAIIIYGYIIIYVHIDYTYFKIKNVWKNLLNYCTRTENMIIISRLFPASS